MATNSLSNTGGKEEGEREEKREKANGKGKEKRERPITFLSLIPFHTGEEIIAPQQKKGKEKKPTAINKYTPTPRCLRMMQGVPTRMPPTHIAEDAQPRAQLRRHPPVSATARSSAGTTEGNPPPPGPVPAPGLDALPGGRAASSAPEGWVLCASVGARVSSLQWVGQNIREKKKKCPKSGWRRVRGMR